MISGTCIYIVDLDVIIQYAWHELLLFYINNFSFTINLSLSVVQLLHVSMNFNTNIIVIVNLKELYFSVSSISFFLHFLVHKYKSFLIQYFICGWYIDRSNLFVVN